jgi:hypothetical protein
MFDEMMICVTYKLKWASKFLCFIICMTSEVGLSGCHNLLIHYHFYIVSTLLAILKVNAQDIF